jgi:hypothetical protein
MKSRNTYSLVASLLLTAMACARQEEPDYDYGDDDEMMDEGGTTSTGSGGKSSLPLSGSTSTTAGTGGSGTKLPPAGSGGKGGTKSTGGTGGKATGGTSSGSGGGGSGGTGGGEEPTENDPVPGITVTFKAQEGSGDVDFLGGELFVNNDSVESFSLASIKIRYYFTNELLAPPMFIWQWGQHGPANNLGGITCTGTVVEMPAPKPGANYYVEVTCPDGMFTGGNQLRTSWKAGNQGSGKLTQEGDWSYIAEGEAPKVVVMEANRIIWGDEP